MVNKGGKWINKGAKVKVIKKNGGNYKIRTKWVQGHF